jgi:hypothetical protein
MRLVGQAISIALATMILGVIVGTQTIAPADYPNLLTAIRVTFAILTALSIVGVAASLARGPIHLHEKPDQMGSPTADL